MPSPHPCGCCSVLVSLALAAVPPLHAQTACPIRFAPLPVVTLVPSESVHVDWPQPIRSSDGLYLISQQVTVWHSTNIASPRLEVAESVAGLAARGPLGPWRLLPAPPGATRRQFPVAVVHGRMVGMIWGSAPGDSTGRSTSELWFAEYDGRSWTRPHAIVTGRAIASWTNDAPASVSRVGDTLLVAVVVNDSTGPYVAVFRGVAGTWRESRIATQALSWDPVSYVTVAGGSGEVDVAFVTPDRSRADSRNSVFELRSLDGGRTWSAPRQVFAGAGSIDAQESQLLRLDDSTHALQWAIRIAGAVTPDSLGFQTERGEARQQSTVAIAGGFSPQHQAVVDARGVLHLVTIARDRGIVYTRRSGTSWCDARLPGTERALATPAVLPWVGDSLLVWWTEPLDPRGYLPVTRTGVITSHPQPGRER